MRSSSVWRDPAIDDGRRRRLTLEIGLLLILLVAGAVRWRLLDVPLERDEGEYAYGAQLLLDGRPLYDELYSKKLPGAFGAYVVFLTLFGETARGVHTGLLLINAISTLLVYRLARRLLGAAPALASAAIFALLSAGRAVQGPFANAEALLLPFALAGLLLALRAGESGGPLRYLTAGLCLGLACLMKQHGALLALPALLLPLLHHETPFPRRVTRSAWLAAGAALPLLLTALLLWRSGTFQSFWFWTVTYAATYGTRIGAAEGWANLVQRGGSLVGSAPLLWLLAALGLAALVRRTPQTTSRAFLVLLSAGSLLAVTPGLYFRPHYFLLLLPAVSILAPLGARTAADLVLRSGAATRSHALAATLLLLGLTQGLFEQGGYLLRSSPDEVSRATFGRNPFPESPRIGELIAEQTDDDDRVAILGSEPQILFYARRRSATGFVYVYDLMETHPRALEMQRRMADEIELARPALLVAVNVRTSWAVTPDSERWIFSWLDGYRGAFDRTAALTIDEQTATLHTAERLAQLTPDARPAIEIFSRR